MILRVLIPFQYTQYTSVRRTRRTDNTHVYCGPLPFRGGPVVHAVSVGPGTCTNIKQCNENRTPNRLNPGSH
jgi:hypothetical protein